MPNVTYVQNVPGFNQEFRLAGGTVYRQMLSMSRKMERAAISKANKDTGRMASKIKARVEVRANGITIIMESKASYSMFVHQGTRPHTIKPRTKKALSWPGARPPGMFSRVNHPGYRGNPFLVEAMNQTVIKETATPW